MTSLGEAPGEDRVEFSDGHSEADRIMQATVMTASTTQVETKLRAEGVTKTFVRDGTTTNVLEEINLEVAKGEFLCLLGPSGCGKSTFLNIAAGFLDPSTGQIKVDGEAVRGPDPRRIFV